MKLTNDHANWKKAILSAAAAVSMGSMLSSQAAAQCVAGLGATPAELASQTWPTATAGMDLTSAELSELGMGPQPHSFGTLTSVATDGQGTVFVLDTTGQSGSSQEPATGGIWRFSANSLAGGALTAQSATSFVGSSVRPSNVFYAGGILWASDPNGNVVPPNNPTKGFEQPISLGASIQGATFDGQYVWFSTAKGALISVKPPQPSTANPGAWTAPSIVQSVPVTSGSLGTLLFDGQFIWTYSGSALYRFDPTTGQSTSFSMTSLISSITFDGTYIWVGSQTSDAVTQVDAQSGSATASLATPMPGHVFFEGSSLKLIYQAGAQIANVRVCDDAATAPAQLPANPVQEVFDGTRTWLVYGNNTLSLR